MESKNGYRIYSSNAGHEPSENVFILTQHHFVALLNDKVIILSEEPAVNAYTTFNSQDKWAISLQNLGSGSKCSLMLDPTQMPDKALQSFQFKINTPLGQATFESSSETLESAFGKEPAAAIRPPGLALRQGGHTLYCGLVEHNPIFESTVAQVFEYAGLENLAGYLPADVYKLIVNLDTSNYSGQRNALWFSPAPPFGAFMELHF